MTPAQILALDLATLKQLCFLSDLMRDCKLTDDDRAAYFLKITGKVVLSTGEITKKHASVMINELKNRWQHIQRGYTPPELGAPVTPAPIASETKKLPPSSEVYAQQLSDLFRDCGFRTEDRKAFFMNRVGREIVFLDDLTADEALDTIAELRDLIDGKLHSVAVDGPPPWD